MWGKWDLEVAFWRKSGGPALHCVALQGNCSWAGATHGLAPGAWALQPAGAARALATAVQL